MIALHVCKDLALAVFTTILTLFFQFETSEHNATLQDFHLNLETWCNNY